MLIGYVSDERYSAIAEVQFEFRREDGSAITARSSITGAVRAELPAGDYQVAFGREGYGSKIISLRVESSMAPHHFRLLADRLLGYMWPKAARSGQHSEFRVHAVEEYSLSLWRYGREKQFIRRIGIFDEHAPRANMQVTPEGDYTRTGVQWNKNGFHRDFQRQLLEAPQQSGLYFLHARGKSGEFFSFPWIIAPQQPTSSIAVLASDINWNAYNSFGGRSNYLHADQFPPSPTVNARLELKNYTEREHRVYDADQYAPLSLDRPDPYNHIDEQEQLTDPIGGRQGCHMAAAEWRLLGWMEGKGLQYDLYSETQFHHGEMPLDSYRVLVLSTHPEYWSAKMYRELKQWVFHSGGKLVYLGGNGLNCEVEFLDEHRIVYQNTRWSHSEPQYDAEGREIESRFAKRQESEANLLGVAFSFPGIMTAAPYRVRDASHWCFEGTGLQNGDLFGSESLHLRVPGGASGHETDKMSPSSPEGTACLAKGTNPNNGGAEIVHVAMPGAGGGEVFSVGSICWPASVLVDTSVSRITENVLRRFSDS